MKLSEYLEKQDLKQAEFARVCGVPRERINKIANESDVATLPEALKISEATNGRVSALEIVSEKNKQLLASAAKDKEAARRANK
jgi:DNA-binding XRE family transcriptional regulator